MSKKMSKMAVSGFSFFFPSCVQRLVGGKVTFRDHFLICTRDETADLLARKKIQSVEIDMDDYFQKFLSGISLIDISRQAAAEVREKRKDQLMLYAKAVSK